MKLNINVLGSANTGLYFLYIILVFGALCLIVFLIRKFVINKNKDKKEKPDEEKAASETLNRYLEDVKDPEAQKQFDEYEQNSNNENK